ARLLSLWYPDRRLEETSQFPSLSCLDWFDDYVQNSFSLGPMRHFAEVPCFASTRALPSFATAKHMILLPQLAGCDNKIGYGSCIKREHFVMAWDDCLCPDFPPQRCRFAWAKIAGQCSLRTAPIDRQKCHVNSKLPQARNQPGMQNSVSA